jgi:SAM-dependent methyltransferase
MFDVEDRHWWYVGNHENFIKILQKYQIIKNGINVLDAGCGTGGWLQVLKNNCDVNETGLDNRKIAIELAATRSIKNLVLGDINSYSFPTSTFDLITSFDVIYHRDVNESLAISNFYKSLKDNGFLLLTVPAFSFLHSKHDEVVHGKKRYTKKQIKILLENNGFEIVKLSYCVSLLFPVALIKRFADKLFSSKNKDHNEVEMPSSFINRLFLSVMRLENFLLKYISFPIGLSVVVMAKKIKSGS